MEKKTNRKLNIKESMPVSLIYQVKRTEKAYIAFLCVAAITIAIMLRSLFLGQWERTFTCFLTLILTLIPPFVEKKFRVVLPATMQIIAFIFVFCAEILGEIACFYVTPPFSWFWDTALHTVNGFLFAAFGFCLVDILNKRKSYRFTLSPMYIAIVAFCFAMTIGVLWEFFEFGVDMILSRDMQKDSIVTAINSVTFDPANTNKVYSINDIRATYVMTASGETIMISNKGYMDLGLIDTMKDLIVNFIGAAVFSIIGYFYLHQKGKGTFANHFIPVPIADDMEEESEENAPQNEDSLPEVTTETVPSAQESVLSLESDFGKQ
jgi:hypothetical protein